MQLEPDMIAGVLAGLGVEAASPSLPALDALVAAYVRTVPWESASRIARRARMARTEDCPRWPDIFWDEALTQGTGGTCFESNYAFFTLLQGLGYEGNLTINNMEETAACHTAIIVWLDGARWLVDVGIPLHVPVPLADTTTQRASPIHDYSAEPDGAGHYTITRSRHPQPYIFTLIDRPVDEATYRAALQADYGPGGYFLDRVVLSKVIDNAVWRFNSGEPPAHLQQFVDGERMNQIIDGPVSARVSAQFGIDRAIVQAAFDALKQTGEEG